MGGSAIGEVIEDIGKGFESLMKAAGVMLALCIIFIPFGIWKMIELVISWFN